MKKLILLFLLALGFSSAAMAVTIVRNGKPVGRIVVDNDSVNQVAAVLLQDFVKRISGAKLPIAERNSKIKRGDVVIPGVDTQGLSEDGFRVKACNGALYISSGGDKGAIYGVVTLLERLGVNYYGEHEYSLTPMSDIELSDDLEIAENPAFRYRQSQLYAMATDPIYRLWMRLEEPRDEFAGGLWVHTFDRLLPSHEYGTVHPEYYSYINGERRPGRASQWCLSNPEVFEIVAERIDSIFNANPGKNMISVSQNDGNHTYCTCEKCSEVMEREGGPAGIYVEFLNKLAARRPDKQFSTLAYLFTMHAPKHVKPLPNVNIMLCDIDAKREVPLTDNASGQDFVKALKDWAAISQNIFVWDYGINFDGYLAPFPNFPIMQKNIQLFRDNNVTMHFSQIAGSRGGDFAEMRTYVASKLMWNPDLNVDSLMRTFMEGYYGDAAPYLYEYEKLLEGGLLASNKDLWIYDSPVSHKEGMLNEKCRKRYNELFDRAEQAVALDSVRLNRVQRQRLSLQFPELEIARAEGRTDKSTEALLALFEQRVRQFNVPTLNERHNSPLDYVKLYRERYLGPKGVNKALGAKVKWGIAPTGRYKELGEHALADDIYGGTSFVENWVGWEGTDGDFVLDLGEPKTFSHIHGDFLHQLGQWIFLPPHVRFETSGNGVDFTEFGEVQHPEDRSPQVKFKALGCSVESPVTARYIRVHVKGIEVCPTWHYGVGSPGWFFLDEIVVD
ncbi:MAG: DUF4838 domain-containing protein [Firmicutes bacterium]|nr:DUF4838 domain-containing protein [Bacillota bacterium]